MKTLLLLITAALASCGYNGTVTASYSGTRANGDAYSIGISVPLKSGKEARKVTP